MEIFSKLYNNSDKYAISEEKHIQMDEKNLEFDTCEIKKWLQTQ